MAQSDSFFEALVAVLRELEDEWDWEGKVDSHLPDHITIRISKRVDDHLVESAQVVLVGGYNQLDYAVLATQTVRSLLNVITLMEAKHGGKES